LIYQVAWVRLLGLSLGSTSATVSTVLVAFFFGMAAGSALAGRFTRGDRRDLQSYIVLEGLIALAATALLPILLQLDQILAFAGDMGTWVSLKIIGTVALLAIPTMCMGATFPFLAGFVLRRGHNIGSGLGHLYALNTAGAVIGAALSGFALIPNLGLDGAVTVGVGLNLLVVVCGLLLVRQINPERSEIEAPQLPQESTGSLPSLRFYALLVLVITGATSIAAQVGWTKYLALFTGATVYGFTTILIIFLSGIAIGAWVARLVLHRLQTPGVWLAAGVVAAGMSMHFSRAGLSLLPELQDTIRALELPAIWELATKGIAISFALLPPTLIFGALFPLSLSLYCGRDPVGRRVGGAYAANTVASVLGSIVAGFVVIPIFGTDALLSGVATLLVLLPLVLQPLWAPSFPERGRVVGAVVTLGVLGILMPHLDYVAKIESVDYQFGLYQRGDQQPRYLFVEEGKAGVISAVTYDGRYVYIQNDGLKESWIDTQDPNNRMIVESLLGFVPYLLHPNPKSAFVVGFGGGTTARALTETDLEQIRVVELEPAVVRAVRAVRATTGTVPAALRDPRVEVTFNDARNTLVVEGRSYDIILSQPSHPWRSGAGNLFTRKFFRIVNSRLHEDGIFAQWVNLFNMDATTLRSIFQAFFEVFPHGFAFVHENTGDMLLFGSPAELRFDFTRIGERLKTKSIGAALGRDGILEPQHLLRYFGLSRAEALAAAGNAPPNRDVRLFSEFRLALLDDLTAEENPYNLIARHARLDILDLIDSARSSADLFLYGQHCLAREDYRRARLAYARLGTIDPDLAARLQRQSPVSLETPPS